MKDRKKQMQEEDALLDELEALTSRMKTNAGMANVGANRSIGLIDTVYAEVESASAEMAIGRTVLLLFSFK